ncbi:hypothetical protein RRG08_048068 [Elysia crispata]|uniref:Uncharacterized protein n=1 Tax=Elysia crispata TaxID=231223 RepID=A0AAE0Z2H0_9GAST|nr:hypothetical protein RRG08_048068 [Elysia crispata]
MRAAHWSHARRLTSGCLPGNTGSCLALSSCVSVTSNARDKIYSGICSHEKSRCFVSRSLGRDISNLGLRRGAE